MVCKVIEDLGSRRLEICYEDSKVYVKFWTYPLYPYGNYVEDVIELDGNVLSMYRVRMNYNGTGRDDIGYVVLAEDEVKTLIDVISSANGVDDFIKIAEVAGNMIYKREREFDDVLHKVRESILELIHTDEKLRRLRELTNTYELVKLLYECVETYVTE